MTHKLKILPKYFKAVKDGVKVSEIRKNDRDFKVGDKIVLKEWDGSKYTGQEIQGTIIYILKDFEGLKDGYVLLDIIYSDFYENYYYLHLDAEYKKDWVSHYDELTEQFHSLLNDLNDILSNY